ncbi:hypothetical protein Tco_0408317 [Tanacetum coccineum]
MDDLLQLVPQLMTRIDSLKKELKNTKQTYGNAILTLVKRVKDLEVVLKRRTKRVIASKDEGFKEKKLGTKLKFDEEINAGFEVNYADEEINTAFEDISTGSVSTGDVNPGLEGVNTGSIPVSSGSAPVIADSTRVSIPSPPRTQREGKAPMTIEEAPKKSKEQILQEEASLAEAIRLDTLQNLEDEEKAKKLHLDALLAQRMFEAQSYTEEDWDIIRAKLEANAELKESVLGKDLVVEDYARKMVELVNQRKKHFAEERARAKRNKPMTQTQIRNYMSTFLKNQGTWKLKQLKNLTFEEDEKEIDEAELVKKSSKRRKQIARKGLHSEVTEEDETEGDKDTSEKVESTSGTYTPINHVPIATKPSSIATYKIIRQGKKDIYQVVREDRTDKVYISFGAMLNDISRDDLIELYRILMNRYGMEGPEDELEKVLWGYLKNMFDAPLSTNSIWSLPGQQKIINWRYYPVCRVHCLSLESTDIYILTERRYPLLADVCKTMVSKKLQAEKILRRANAVKIKIIPRMLLRTTSKRLSDEDTQRNLKSISEDQVRGGLLGIIVNRLKYVKSGSYRS